MDSPDDETDELRYTCTVVDPSASREDLERSHGLFGRMASQPCILDCVPRHATMDDMLDVIRNQLLIHRQERQRVGRPVPVRMLWVMSTDMPVDLDTLGFVPAKGWPPGIYFNQLPGLPISVVVLSEVPREPSTLVLRVQGRGPGFFEAVEEVLALPVESRFRGVVLAVLGPLVEGFIAEEQLTRDQLALLVRVRALAGR
jgi:hypothetical protein